MPRFLLDSSCMVARLCSWHEHYRATADEIERRLDRGEEMVVAAPALVETYAVLTRLPSPHRLSPADAELLASTNFRGGGIETTVLDADDYHSLLRTAAAQNIAGGRIYDAVILACARSAGINTLLTLNERHFRSLITADIEMVVPVQSSPGT